MVAEAILDASEKLALVKITSATSPQPRHQQRPVPGGTPSSLRN